MASLSLLLFFPVLAHAQAVNQVYIFPAASLYAHPGSNTNIFSDISQGGTFVSYDTSLINFYARVWQNESGSRLPDESNTGIDGIGGIFRFSDQLLNAQRIITIGSQPYNGFPNLRIDNLLNVTAETGNLHVNNILDFVNGNMVLNNVDINVGRNGLGTITGYGSSNFIVTGSGITGGSLVRSFAGSATAATDYPIGTALNSYTPVSVIYKGIPQNIKFRVADNVYNKLNFPEYVNKTWVMGRDFPDAAGTVDLTIQHNSRDEGIEYFRNRTEAYVTRYDQNLTGLWDIVPPVPTITPGTITTRATVFDAFMNTRLNIGAIKTVEYFSKSVIKKDIDENTPVNIPDAISPNGDGLNDNYIIAKRLPADKVRFEVYSRNHVLVYQNLDYQDEFNGIGNMGGFLGDVLPDGIFYYLISVNGAKGIPGYLIINR
ncbi:MAG: T9SS type B sorting domain-containing protein [Daejeonella sp.]